NVMKRNQEAETDLRAAVNGYEKIAAQFPLVAEYQFELANSQSGLGNVLRDLGKASDAESSYRAALTALEKLIIVFPEVRDYHSDLAGVCCNLGNLLRDTADEAAPVESALQWYDKAIATLEPILARDSRLVVERRFLSNSHLGRAKALATLGRFD